MLHLLGESFIYPDSFLVQYAINSVINTAVIHFKFSNNYGIIFNIRLLLGKRTQSLTILKKSSVFISICILLNKYRWLVLISVAIIVINDSVKSFKMNLLSIIRYIMIYKIYGHSVMILYILCSVDGLVILLTL